MTAENQEILKTPAGQTSQGSTSPKEPSTPGEPVLGDKENNDEPDVKGSPESKKNNDPETAGKNGGDPGNAEKDDSDEERTPGEGSSVTVKAGEFRSDAAYIASEIHINEGRTSIKNFSLKEHTNPILQELLKQELATYVYNEDTLSKITSALRKHHIILLTGEPDVGKRITALFLVNSLVRNGIQKSYITSSIPRNMRIDLREIADSDDFTNTVLVLKDVFSQKNSDLSDFIKHMEQLTLGNLSQKLQENNNYLILTADLSTIPMSEQEFMRLGFVQKLEVLTEELLLQGISLKLAKYVEDTEEFQEGFPESIKRELLSKENLKIFKTLPRFNRFLRDSLVEISKGELTIRNALLRLDNLEDWFLQLLRHDFDTWCFSFSLGISYIMEDTISVRWVVFENLRSSISDALKKEIKDFWPRVKLRSLPVQEVLSEVYVLKKCDVEIYFDPAMEAECIRFKDSEFGKRFWKEVLFRSNHAVIHRLVPVIRALAEDHNIFMRIHAAQILGKLGELDPVCLIFPVIYEWAHSDRPYLRATVGHLYQGILSSQNENYKNECLKYLVHYLSSHNNPNLQWTAIATYKQIGQFDLELGMRGLQKIATERYSEKFDDRQKMDRFVNHVERAIERQLSDIGVENVQVRIKEEIVQSINRTIFSKADFQLWSALQYSIITLCLETDPILVFKKLMTWMQNDEDSLNLLVTMMFLSSGGIADELEKILVPISETRSELFSSEQECNPIVLSLKSKNSSSSLAGFIFMLFDNISSFPPQSKSYYRKSLLEHLKEWALKAKPFKKWKEAMIRFYVELLSRDDLEAKKQLYDFITKDSELNDFTNEVLHELSNRDKSIVPW